MPRYTHSGSASERRQRALGRQITLLRESRDMSQTDFGLEIDTGLPQTTVSRWERGAIELTLEQVLDIESAFGLTPGTLARAAGYVMPLNDEAISVEQAIAFDTRLTDDAKVGALSSYKSYVNLSSSIRAKMPPEKPSRSKRRSIL